MNPIFLLMSGFVGGYAVSQGRKPKTSARVLPPAPKEPVLTVGQNCSSWSVLDQPRLDLTLLFVYARERLNGRTNPLEITNTILRDIVGACGGTNKPPRNLGEYELILLILNSVMQDMEADETLTAGQKTQAFAEANDWAMANGALFGG